MIDADEQARDIWADAERRLKAHLRVDVKRHPGAATAPIGIELTLLLVATATSGIIGNLAYDLVKAGCLRLIEKRLADGDAVDLDPVSTLELLAITAVREQARRADIPVPARLDVTEINTADTKVTLVVTGSPGPFEAKVIMPHFRGKIRRQVSVTIRTVTD